MFEVLKENWPFLLLVLVVMFLFVPYDLGMGCGWAGPRIVEIIVWLYRRLKK